MRIVALIAAAVVALSPVMASAEPVPLKARKLAERGRELHQKGDYSRAIAAFKEAYVIAPSAGLLFNLAQAYRLQGNCDDSALMYRRYIATGLTVEGRTLAEAHLATVERCVQKRGLNIPMDETMAYLKLPTAPSTSELLLVQTASRSDETPGRGARLKKDIGVGVTIGGGVALAAAAYFGVRAYSASNEVERLYAQGAKWKDIEPIHARGQRAATDAKLLGVTGGLAVAAGVTLFVLGKRGERALPIAVAPTTRGAQVGMAWSF